MLNLASDRVFCQLIAPVPMTPYGPDGMKVDVEGNVYSTGPGGVWIIDPAGNHLGTIHTGASDDQRGFGAGTTGRPCSSRPSVLCTASR